MPASITEVHLSVHLIQCLMAPCNIHLIGTMGITMGRMSSAGSYMLSGTTALRVSENHSSQRWCKIEHGEPCLARGQELLTSSRWLLVLSCRSPCTCSFAIPVSPSISAAALRASAVSPCGFAPSSLGTSHAKISLQANAHMPQVDSELL